MKLLDTELKSQYIRLDSWSSVINNITRRQGLSTTKCYQTHDKFTKMIENARRYKRTIGVTLGNAPLMLAIQCDRGSQEGTICFPQLEPKLEVWNRAGMTVAGQVIV